MSSFSLLNTLSPEYSVSHLGGGVDMAQNTANGDVGTVNAIQTATFSGPLYVTLPAGTYFVNMYALIGTTEVDATCPYCQLFIVGTTGTIYAQSNSITTTSGPFPLPANYACINQTVRISLTVSTQLTMQAKYAQCTEIYEVLSGKLTAYRTV